MTATLAPTADRRPPKNRTEKDTISTTESNNNNNNNKTNDNPAQADDDKHIPGQSDHLLEQQKAAEEAIRWEKERMEESYRQIQQKRQRLERERERERQRMERDRQSHQKRQAHQQQQRVQREQEHHQVAFRKPKKILVQSKLAFRIVPIVHTKTKQPKNDNEIDDMYDAIHQQIINNRKKVSSVRTEKETGKQKKKVRYGSIGTSGESRKRSKDTEYLEQSLE
mmetsp:Transcript_12680/g.13610  ORF Transcript_12680/g.13610 Transcript_12680/m.13610 type:complete len:224 (+) Transcript_12680:132-803(+)